MKPPNCILNVFEASHTALMNENFNLFVFLSVWDGHSHLVSDTHADNLWHSIMVVLLCDFLIANDAQTLLMCLASFHIPSLINCCFRALHISFSF